MYTPPSFRETDLARVRGLMRSDPFAALVTRDLTVTHLPFVLHDGEPVGTLYGHVARANPHWRNLDDGEVLVVFGGPHAYVSPAWYAEPDENVPTWNYVAVHAYGTARAITDRDRLRELLEEQVRVFDSSWRPIAEKVEQLLGGIVGIEIDIRRFDAKWKVSQNRNAADRAAAAQVLATRPDEGSRAIAAWMRELGLV